jgi:hypothetical protein
MFTNCQPPLLSVMNSRLFTLNPSARVLIDAKKMIVKTRFCPVKNILSRWESSLFALIEYFRLNKNLFPWRVETSFVLCQETQANQQECPVHASDSSKAEKSISENVESAWDRAKDFKDMPGPKPTPILGNIWRLIPKIGERKYEVFEFCIYLCYLPLQDITM